MAPADIQASSSRPSAPPHDLNNPHDIFARLYPAGELWTSKKMIWDHPDVVKPESWSDERESTTSPEPDSWENQPFVPLRFSKPPLDGSGYVFGIDRNVCDFVLEKRSSLSRRHFTIGFEDLSLFIRDLGSRYGTSVRYSADQEDVLPRSQFKWIASDPVVFAHGLVITLAKDIAFYLDVVPDVFNNLPRLAENLQLFRRGASVEDRLNHFDLRSSFLPTGGRIETPLPTSRRLLIDTRLNLGKSLSVFLNVSTGERAVLRKFSGDMRLRSRWVRTVKALRDTEHLHLIHPFLIQNDYLEVYLPYFPTNAASSHCQQPFTSNECSTISYQVLAALSYLHTGSSPAAFHQKPHHDAPLIHGNINPGAILVTERSDQSINIKLTDFRATITGLRTSIFTAPERSRGEKVTEAVDVWSFGVTMLWFLGHLPLVKIDSTRLKQEIAQLVEELDDSRMTTLGRVHCLLKDSVIYDPEERQNAEDIFLRACSMFMANPAASSHFDVSEELESVVDTASPGPAPTDPFVTFDEIGHVPPSRSASLVPQDYDSVMSERPASLVSQDHDSVMSERPASPVPQDEDSVMSESSESTVRGHETPAAERPQLPLSPPRSIWRGSNLRMTRWGSQQLALDPYAKMVNLTHILKKFKKSNRLAEFRRRYDSNFQSRGVSSRFRGTYVSYDDVLRILNDLGVTSPSLKQILEIA